MAKGLYHSLRKLWRRPSREMIKPKVVKWRKQNVVERIEKPTRLDRARSLGYKAKQGFVVCRIRIKKGGRKRPSIRKGRVPKKFGQVKFTPSKSKQHIAEERVAQKYPNLEVLNSYYVAEDGQYKYYEVILVDPQHPVIQNDKDVFRVARQRRRAFRGLTSAAKKSRALGKGKGYERRSGKRHAK